MTRFKDIELLAAKRKGGKAALAQLLNETRPLDGATLAAIPADRVLATMTRRVFYSGFSTKVVDGKWASFESAFSNFDPEACARLSGTQIDALARNPDIIRNRAKIRSVPANAQFVLDLAHSDGSAASFFAN
jgi:3-methyladenine DNA glycosylase Tag